jgi:hypothetical protein
MCDVKRGRHADIVFGAAHFYATRGKHIVTVKTEHKAVLDACRELERQGFESRTSTCRKTGSSNLEGLVAALTGDQVGQLVGGEPTFLLGGRRRVVVSSDIFRVLLFEEKYPDKR